jgi:hypothetical protein
MLSGDYSSLGNEAACIRTPFIIELTGITSWNGTRRGRLCGGRAEGGWVIVCFVLHVEVYEAIMQKCFMEPVMLCFSPNGLAAPVHIFSLLASWY